jgi:hypothetical protein
VRERVREPRDGPIAGVAERSEISGGRHGRSLAHPGTGDAEPCPPWMNRLMDGKLERESSR